LCKLIRSELADALKRKPSVSIVIVNYNGVKFIKRCLESVLNDNYTNFEVILIDNASADGSFELVKNLFGLYPHLRIIRSNENLGYVGGNNIGFKYSKGKYVIFLNQDVEVNQHWLRELIKVMESDPTIGAAQCKLLRLYDKRRIDSTGQLIDFLGYGHPRGDENKGQYAHMEEIFYADGAALTVRRQIIDEVSFDGLPFDPDYSPMYYEDADLCWRIRLRGYKVMFVPGSIVYHARSAAELHKMSSHLIFSHVKNRIATLIKNYSLKNLLRYMPLLLVFEAIRAIILLKIKPSHSIAILRAILWNLKNLNGTWRKRLIIQRLVRKVSDSYLMKYMVKFNPTYLYHSFRKYYGMADDDAH